MLFSQSHERFWVIVMKLFLTGIATSSQNNPGVEKSLAGRCDLQQQQHNKNNQENREEMDTGNGMIGI